MPNEKPLQLLLNIDETGHALGIGRTSIYALIESGALPIIKIGRRTLIRLSAIEEFIAASEITKGRNGRATSHPRSIDIKE